MREILFRGKRLDDIGWVKGFLVGDNSIRWCDGYFECEKTDGSMQQNVLVSFVVYPDTIGQFTGLIDKNGKQIFEGDIVKYVDDGYVATGVARFGLYASAGAAFAGHEGFYLDWAGCDWLRKDIGFWATMRPIEIIGNIHDNPELMEDE